uniref:T-complex 11 n=1 Tax=Meloidogyne incognita TaxID=6306 RepID=A0A914N257_MELIC
MPFKEDNKNNNDAGQNERNEDDKLNNETFTDSPEKKRQKQGSPQLNEDSPQCSTSQKISENKNDGNNIPNWVAGSSPAKYLSLDELIKVHDSIEKMAIVHQIAVNPLCKVEDLRRQCPHSKLHETVKNDMQKAFWDLLRDDLSKNPPDKKNAFSLIVDLKNMITEHLESANLLNALSAVNEALDFEHLQNLFDKNALNLNEILGTILSVLERLCAPIRDELVIKLRSTEDTIELFKGIFELVELMKMDMANFALSQNRQLITSQSAKIEFEEFMKIYEMDKSVANNIRQWLCTLLKEFLKEKYLNIKEEKKSICLSHSDINELILKFYLELLISFSTKSIYSSFQFPETIKMDEKRIEELKNKLLQLELLSSSLFASINLAGRLAIESKQLFKIKLKNELIILLNDLNFINCSERLENIAIQCCKHCEKEFGENFGWNEERSKMLKQQILNFVNPEEPVRKIAMTRICDFIRQVLKQSGDPLKIPPGMSTFQTELASFTSRYYAIVMHNWNTFGRFYAQILDEEFSNII